MSAEGRTVISQQFERLLALYRCLDLDVEGWELFEGDMESSPRQPWFIAEDQGHRILTLGFTERSVQVNLSSMCSALALLRGC